jgi:hypothetical protein
LGAATSAGIAYCADFHAGAGVCLADVSAVLWRAVGAAGVAGSGVDPGGDCSCGASANLSRQESTPTYCGRLAFQVHNFKVGPSSLGPPRCMDALRPFASIRVYQNGERNAQAADSRPGTAVRRQKSERGQILQWNHRIVSVRAYGRRFAAAA